MLVYCTGPGLYNGPKAATQAHVGPKALRGFTPEVTIALDVRVRVA